MKPLTIFLCSNNNSTAVGSFIHSESSDDADISVIGMQRSNGSFSSGRRCLEHQSCVKLSDIYPVLTNYTSMVHLGRWVPHKPDVGGVKGSTTDIHWVTAWSCEERKMGYPYNLWHCSIFRAVKSNHPLASDIIYVLTVQKTHVFLVCPFLICLRNSIHMLI